jgi:hypothetical protein
VKIKINSGTTGWIALAVGVVVWDLCAEETLTGAFRRSHDSPVARVIVMTAWGLLTAHLFSAISPRIDVLDSSHYSVITRRTPKGKRLLLIEEK